MVFKRLRAGRPFQSCSLLPQPSKTSWGSAVRSQDLTLAPGLQWGSQVLASLSGLDGKIHCPVISHFSRFLNNKDGGLPLAQTQQTLHLFQI